MVTKEEAGERFEYGVLLALKIEEGVMRKGMWAASRSKQR
jgi:hypothetical protein